MEIAHCDLLILPNDAPLDASDGNAPHKLVVINGGDQHLEGGLGVRLRGGDIVEDGLEQRLEIGALHLGGVGCSALPPGAKQHGGVQLFTGSVQIQQQLQHLVHDLVDPLVGTVDLVDHHNDPVSQLQRLAQNKPGLGHRPLCGVYQ